jgi:hypothetical protein
MENLILDDDALAAVFDITSKIVAAMCEPSKKYPQRPLSDNNHERASKYYRSYYRDIF